MRHTLRLYPTARQRQRAATRAKTRIAGMTEFLVAGQTVYGLFLKQVGPSPTGRRHHEPDDTL